MVVWGDSATCWTAAESETSCRNHVVTDRHGHVTGRCTATFATDGRVDGPGQSCIGRRICDDTNRRRVGNADWLVRRWKDSEPRRGSPWSEHLIPEHPPEFEDAAGDQHQQLITMAKLHRCDGRALLHFER